MNDIVGSGRRGAVEPRSVEVAAELLDAISGIRRIARRAVRQAWHDEPLPPAQGELLRLTAAKPGVTVAEAAHELRLAPNTVSTLVGRLSDAGLLDRTRAEADGRSVRLTITPAAKRRLAGYRDLRTELTGRALDQLSARDRRAIAEAVPALLRLAEQLEIGGSLAGGLPLSRVACLAGRSAPARQLCPLGPCPYGP